VPILSVIIPAFNEARTLGQTLTQVLGQESPDLSLHIIVVDDGSHDETAQIAAATLEGSNHTIIRHEQNLGKGAALQSAQGAVVGDFAIIQDADLEYSPTDWPRLLDPLISGHADVVYGTRFSGSEAKRVLYFWHSLGNGFLTLLSNMFTNLNLTDMETGYKVFRSDVFRRLNLREKGFGIEPEITAKIAKADLRIYEVAISYRGRTYAEGKKINWKDGFWAIWCIVRYGLGRTSLRPH